MRPDGVVMKEGLFQSIKIKSMALRNRLVLAPMGVCLANETGGMTPQLIEFYRERAKGGVALVLLGGGQVTDVRPPGMIAMHGDHMIPGLNDLVEAVKEEGACIGIQLNSSDHFLPPQKRRTPDNLTRGEIEDMINSYVRAAIRAKKAGFDVVEFHGAHGYLISDFLSPLSNHRNDEYGGDAERRRTFALEIVRRTRAEVGSEYPLFFRINGYEFQEGGVDIDEAKHTAKHLEQEGVDAIDVSGGRRPFTDHWTIAPMSLPSGHLVPLAEAVKREVNVPVITAGKIDISLAIRIVDEEKADLIAMGRGLVADPLLPQKAMDGRLQEIRSCIYCNYCIGKRTRLQKRIRCAVNASAGREGDFSIAKSRARKRILIVGGGLAGLECARILSLRGHEVILKEKEDHLGGQAWLASIPQQKASIRAIISHLEYELNRLGVRIDLNVDVMSKDIDTLKPDVVILATGASPTVPDIAGIKGDTIKTGFQVLRSEGKGLGKNVVIIGGGEIGCEIAEYLAEKGKKITIVEQLEEIGITMELFTKRVFLERIAQYNVRILTDKKVTHVEGNRMHMRGPQGEISSIEFNHAVLAAGTTPNSKLWEEVSPHVPEIYQIGDCVQVNDICQAIYDGAKVGRSI